ncbi:MAG TPA: hypothetical protein VH253_03555 [Phycisphaerae bacterium]|nr:hypothetical protein [Phycisphaerae bacterium]
MRPARFFRPLGRLLGCLSILAIFVLGIASSFAPSLRKGAPHRHTFALIALILAADALALAIIGIVNGFLDISDPQSLLPDTRISADDHPVGFSLYTLLFLAFALIACIYGLYNLLT